MWLVSSACSSYVLADVSEPHYRDTPLPHIAQSLVYVSQPESKLPTLLQYLTSPAGYTPPLIVFTSTQARATSLLSELLIAGVKNAEALHAGLTRHEREQCVKRMLQGEIWVLVTTDVLARGMDFGGVRGVINFDWPESVQSYVHRIGMSVVCLLILAHVHPQEELVVQDVKELQSHTLPTKMHHF